MSHDKNKPPDKKFIAEEISALASSAQPANEGESSYQQESLYAEMLRQEAIPLSFLEELDKRRKNWFSNLLFNWFQKRSDLDHRKKISPAELLAEINTRRAWHSFKEDEEKHKFRKLFLAALFLLTCAWLGTVVYFVYQNAVSPSVDDREKLIQIQAQFETINKTLTNSAMIHVIDPEYRSALFHLSDSVLIAFITSTTVAVLGLFLTAARWLYNAPIGKESNSKKKKQNIDVN